MSMSVRSVSFDKSADRRERWSSRAAFYFAAVGSAVGFGNIWRFPSLIYEYGGAAFFLPYLLALVFVGIPILVLEISLGQYYETGDVDVFGGIHRRLRGVGLCSIACGYMLVAYYSMLLSWVMNAFFGSFQHKFWEGGVTGSEAKAYFYNHVIGMETLGPDLRPTRLVWANAGYSMLTWLIVFVCIAFGIKWTGRITYFTMGFPVLLLFIMLGRSVTLEGAQEGIREYLSCDWSVLVDQPEIWPEAVGQIFFSIGITFGIMTAYGSHCKRDEPAFLNSAVVAASNSLFSFVAGFAVFATLGHLAHLEDAEIKDLEFSSFGLVFGSWPVALGTLPGGEHWVRLFLFMLFILGIDSAFSFMEGFLICLSDTAFLRNVDKLKLTVGLTFQGWAFSLIYATDAGLIFLDTIDYYINFVMLFVGGVECFSAGWLYNIEEQLDNLGAGIVFTYMTTTFGSVFLACFLWFSVEDPRAAMIAGVVGLVLFYAIGMAVVVYLMHVRKKELGLWSWRSMFVDLAFRNMMDLRDDLGGVVGFLPLFWAFLIKYFVPPVLFVMFAVGCAAETTGGRTEFGNYEGYPVFPYQTLGISTVAFVGFLFFSCLVAPRLYDAFEKPDSPVPSRDATIHVMPEEEARRIRRGSTTLSLNSNPEGRLWPPR